MCTNRGMCLSSLPQTAFAPEPSTTRPERCASVGTCCTTAMPNSVPVFDNVLTSEGVHSLPLPPRSPNLNAYAERWVRSVKQECLSRLILFGERSLQRALTEFIAHFHSVRNHKSSGQRKASFQ